MRTEILPTERLVKHIFPGVMQHTDGSLFKHALTDEGELVLIPHTDTRTFVRTDGTFVQNSLHHIVTDENGTRRI